MWFENFQDGWHGGHLGYQNRTILAILNLHAAPMPSTKIPLHPTNFSEAANNWRLSRWPPSANMDTILMEMSKMWKVTDGHMDEVRTMTNRPRHKLTWSKAPGELTIEDLQDGCCGSHRGYCNKMLFSNSESPFHPNASQWWGLKIFKLVTLGTISDIGSELF